MILSISGYLADSPLLSLLEGRCVTLLHNLVVVPAHHGAGLHYTLAFGVGFICLVTGASHAVIFSSQCMTSLMC